MGLLLLPYRQKESNLFIETTAFDQGMIVIIKKMQNTCIGFKDSTGSYYGSIQISQLPDIFLGLLGTHA